MCIAATARAGLQRLSIVHLQQKRWRKIKTSAVLSIASGPSGLRAAILGTPPYGQGKAY
jgi:hypothetical protein